MFGKLCVCVCVCVCYMLVKGTVKWHETVVCFCCYLMIGFEPLKVFYEQKTEFLIQKQ